MQSFVKLFLKCFVATFAVILCAQGMINILSHDAFLAEFGHVLSFSFVFSLVATCVVKWRNSRNHKD